MCLACRQSIRFPHTDWVTYYCYLHLLLHKVLYTLTSCSLKLCSYCKTLWTWSRNSTLACVQCGMSSFSSPSQLRKCVLILLLNARVNSVLVAINCAEQKMCSHQGFFNEYYVFALLCTAKLYNTERNHETRICYICYFTIVNQQLPWLKMQSWTDDLYSLMKRPVALYIQSLPVWLIAF